MPPTWVDYLTNSGLLPSWSAMRCSAMLYVSNSSSTSASAGTGAHGGLASSARRSSSLSTRLHLRTSRSDGDSESIFTGSCEMTSVHKPRTASLLHGRQSQQLLTTCTNGHENLPSWNYLEVCVSYQGSMCHTVVEPMRYLFISLVNSKLQHVTRMIATIMYNYKYNLLHCYSQQFCTTLLVFVKLKCRQY